jgi:hypothetical protein
VYKGMARNTPAISVTPYRITGMNQQSSLSIGQPNPKYPILPTITAGIINNIRMFFQGWEIIDY